jgi:hypothetical protein
MVAAVGKSPSLTTVELQFNNLGQRGGDSAAIALMNSSRLTYLDLSFCSLPTPAIIAIAL